ncbi:MAG TPA: class I SAM-dependent methyltransferase [Bacilli bacterium]
MVYRQFAYYYDKLMADVPYGQWIEFAEQCWEKYGHPRTVVDLGCGTGNITLPLAQKGLEIIAIDLSEDMLAAGQQKLGGMKRAQANGSVTWLQQDMREWEFPTAVDSVISFCDCLNYLLEEEDVKQTFAQVYGGLKPGGTFIFDVHSPQQLEIYAGEQPFMLNEEDIAYIWTCELDGDRCEIEHSLTIFAKEDNEKFCRIEEFHKQRAYPVEGLRNWLIAAGFSKVNVCADFGWDAPTDESRRIFFVAEKQSHQI